MGVFEEFKKQLAAHGITVVDPAAYASDPNRARLKPDPQGVGAKVQLADPIMPKQPSIGLRNWGDATT
jgi:hypothetical protein